MTFIKSDAGIMRNSLQKNKISLAALRNFDQCQVPSHLSAFSSKRHRKVQTSIQVQPGLARQPPCVQDWAQHQGWRLSLPDAVLPAVIARSHQICHSQVAWISLTPSAIDLTVRCFSEKLLSRRALSYSVFHPSRSTQRQKAPLILFIRAQIPLVCFDSKRLGAISGKWHQRRNSL